MQVVLVREVKMSERKIVEIDLMMAIRAENLFKSLNLAIKEGWQPYGEAFQDEDGYFCMAMVKYD